ncbi:MAG: hypothetical protein GHCLOJNM_02801 [bacterium]|nr:hypothetical protein [bacterium]
MARRPSKTLTELELEIMKIVWDREEATVEEIRDALAHHGKPLALPSVRKMLSILQEKGYVARRPQGRGHAYRTTISRTQAHRSFIRDLVDRAFEGSALGLVVALLKSNLVREDEIAEVKELIDKYELGKDLNGK